jgi:hypothetical protein
MAKVDRTVIVKAPREALWALVGDPVRWPEWQPALDLAERVDAQTVRLFGGGQRTYSYEVRTVAETPLSRIAWTYEVAVRGDGSYDLRDVEGSTEVRMRESLRLNMLPPLRWIIDRAFFNRSFNRAARLALEELQRVAEGRPVE